jgi:para-aminobenzoate synthetase component 1
MVVDLVRNDLSRVCQEGSVRVDELFGVYTYPHVHQMVSTISGELLKGAGLVDILRACFPMGSMTGAPKVRVMELIDEFEEGPRGIYSGSVGYIDPSGDFDFNVVIRSIMYHSREKYLSYKVGSGITFYSDPAKEWEECLLKGAALRRVLEGRA